MKRFHSKLVVAFAPLFFAACATIAPPQPPSLDLPKPPSDLRASRKGDRVILTWTIPSTTTDRQTVRSVGPTQICRAGKTLTQCGTTVGEAPPTSSPNADKASKQKPSASYTDTLYAQAESDSPSAMANYAVVVLNHEGRGAGLSNQVTVPLIHTLPPPRDFQARVTSQGVVLSWAGEATPALENVHYVYRVYRRDDKLQQSLVGDVATGNEGTLSLTDSEIEWEKTYEYRAEILTVIELPNKPHIEVEGDDTPEVKVFADDVFPPTVPTGLQAAFSGPGQQPAIDLVWAPDTDADLAGYNVYRYTAGTAPIKVTGELLKTPAFRDTNVESGKNYFYSVSAVDLRGNESAKSEEASEAVP
jgi:hypothetical protein